jgi:hypothetical protein
MFGSKMTMGRRDLWEKGGLKNTCRLCGQYIDDGQEYYLVVLPFPHSKAERNFIVHSHEWEGFAEGMEDAKLLVEKLSSVKKSRPKNQTKVDETVVEAFKRVLDKRRYRIKKETANRIYFKASRNLAVFYFDKRFKTLEFEGRANGLFDGIFLREFQSRMLEDLQKELGNKPEEGFRVEKVVQEAMKTVEEILN